ncbi:unnamed protein product [Haemonchus placei]|uniref:Zinc finger BED domain-containing protein 5 n=1 Tax=Haemonchus placei TaxID=6290 RepID=A0A0N4W6A8_HAEPC|nr:unnamed protein product [Haemonchus placei]
MKLRTFGAVTARDSMHRYMPKEYMSVADKELAAVIGSNLYLDSLVISADTAAQGIHKYRCLKSIFNDLKMNLRAFQSNNSDIMRAISAPDRSSNTAPKKLGIPWDSVTDKFSLCVNVPREEVVNKRTIAQQIASVNDPFEQEKDEEEDLTPSVQINTTKIDEVQVVDILDLSRVSVFKYENQSEANYTVSYVEAMSPLEDGA